MCINLGYWNLVAFAGAISLFKVNELLFFSVCSLLRAWIPHLNQSIFEVRMGWELEKKVWRNLKKEKSKASIADENLNVICSSYLS